MTEKPIKFKANSTVLAYSVGGYREYAGAKGLYSSLPMGTLNRDRDHLLVTMNDKGINIVYVPGINRLVKSPFAGRHHRGPRAILGWQFLAEDIPHYRSQKGEIESALKLQAEEFNRQGMGAIFKPRYNDLDMEKKRDLKNLVLAVPMNQEMMQRATAFLDAYVTEELYDIEASYNDFKHPLGNDERYAWKDAGFEDVLGVLQHMVHPERSPLPEVLKEKSQVLAAPAAENEIPPATVKIPENPVTTQDKNLIWAAGITAGVSATLLLVAQAVKENVVKVGLRIAGVAGLLIAGGCALAHIHAQKEASQDKGQEL